MAEKPPLGVWAAVRTVTACALTSAVLLARGRVHQPRTDVGRRLRFADGTTPWVYRETTVDHEPAREPAVLVVGFRLRGVRGRGHALFRAESLLNTPLFVGFPGFVSKLWLAHDQNGIYRGLYDWDGPGRAEHYARALWRVLALVCDPRSIHYAVVPGVRRDELLDDPALAEDTTASRAWWRPSSAPAPSP